MQNGNLTCGLPRFAEPEPGKGSVFGSGYGAWDMVPCLRIRYG
jgi:hypothetical protein